MTEFIQNIHLLRPWWLLAFIPLVFLLIRIYIHRQNNQVWKKVCDAELLPFILTSDIKQASRLPYAMLIGASSLVMIALLGPVWSKAPQPAFRTESALIIILDLSLSMMVDDVKPSRLQRAKLKILDVLNQRSEGQTALIVFSLESFTVSPLTQDTNTIALMVPALTADIMPSQGSQLHSAILEAKELFLQTGVTNGHVLVVTDSSTDSEVEKSINVLTSKGHTLSILGVGTSAGAPIQLPGGGFVKDRMGSIVVPKLDSINLQRLARIGGGGYRQLSSTDDDIHYLLSNVSQRLDAKHKNEKLPFETDVWIEQGPWLLLLLLPLAAFYFRRGWMMIVCLSILPIPQPAHAFDWQYLWSTPDQVGQKYYDQGDPEQAARHFKERQWNAASNYNAGNYEQSLQQWEDSSDAESLYNKGNALVKSGKLEDAVQAYTDSIALDKNHQDAIYNRDLVKKHLQEQPSESKDQQNQDGEGEQKDQQQSDSGQESDQQSADNQQESSGDSDSQQQNEKSDENESKQSQAGNEQENTDSEADKQQLAEQQSEQEKQAQEQNEKSADKSDGDLDADTRADAENKAEQNKQDERRLAVEQWLRRVPDDPGGLLRRKFRFQAQVRGGKVKGNNPW